MIQDINSLKNNVLSEINSLSQLMDLVLVPSNTGKIKSSKTIKENNKYKTIDEFVEYKLEQVCVSLPFDDNNIGFFSKYISELKNFERLEKMSFKFFKQNFIEKLFFKRKNSDLINKIKEFKEKYSWIIVNKRVLVILEKSDSYSENLSKDLYKLGSLGKLDLFNIYLNPDEKDDCIYFGNFQTSSLLINKNTVESSTEFQLNYLFVESGDSLQLQIT